VGTETAVAALGSAVQWARVAYRTEVGRDIDETP
jgi:hypothetical protein